ncbi:MAG: COX15/CtaA family protein [Deltaproteobacteria bacterium]|nr:COX15/CtaA family protein [Deltaproteobacteria bacterium]
MKTLLKINLILTFILILWGAVVRVTGSGLGCPDWPLCYGKMLPPFQYQSLLEWGHRMLASWVGLVTLALFVVSCFKKNRGWKTILAAVILILVLVQAGMGALAVKYELDPLVIMIHLAIAMIFFLLMLSLFLLFEDTSINLRVFSEGYNGGFAGMDLLRSKREQTRVPSGVFHAGENDRVPRKILGDLCFRYSQRFFIVLFIVAFAQFVFGGYVASVGAGLGCPDFPLCYGRLLPPSGDLLAKIHFVHRLGALTLLVLSTGILYFRRSLRHYELFEAHGVIEVERGLFILLMIQVALGVLTVIFKLPLPLRILHLAAGIGVVSMSFVLMLKLLLINRRFKFVIPAYSPSGTRTTSGDLV